MATSPSGSLTSSLSSLPRRHGPPRLEQSTAALAVAAFLLLKANAFAVSFSLRQATPSLSHTTPAASAFLVEALELPGAASTPQPRSLCVGSLVAHLSFLFPLPCPRFTRKREVFRHARRINPCLHFPAYLSRISSVLRSSVSRSSEKGAPIMEASGLGRHGRLPAAGSGNLPPEEAPRAPHLLADGTCDQLLPRAPASHWLLPVSRRGLADREPDFCYWTPKDDHTARALGLTDLGGLSHLGEPPRRPRHRSRSSRCASTSILTLLRRRGRIRLARIPGKRRHE